MASSPYDLKSDGVGYSTSGGYLDDVKDQLDAYKADIIGRQDRGADRALTLTLTRLSNREPGGSRPGLCAITSDG